MTRGMLEDPALPRQDHRVRGCRSSMSSTEIDGRGLYSPTEIPRHLHDADGRHALGRCVEAFQVMLSPECRDRETMEIAMAAAHGRCRRLYHACIQTASLRPSSASSECSRRRSGRDRATSLAQSLRLVINCLLVPSTDGRQRHSCGSSWLSGAQERDMPCWTLPEVSDWPRLVRKLLHEQGQTFAVAAKKALEAGIISEDTARITTRGF